MRNITTVVFIGRFQPFHNGHLNVVKELYNEGYGKIAMVVGSEGVHCSWDNPFTTFERCQMIKESLRIHPKIRRKIDLLTIPDYIDDDYWVECICRYNKGDFDVATNNDEVASLFDAKKINVYRPFIYREYSGTFTRSVIYSGQDYTHLVPSGTCNVLQTPIVKRRIEKLVKGS